RRAGARHPGPAALRGRQARAGRAGLGRRVVPGWAAALARSAGRADHAAPGRGRIAARGAPGAPLARPRGASRRRALPRLRVGPALDGLRGAPVAGPVPGRRHPGAVPRGARRRAVRGAVAAHAPGVHARGRARPVPRLERGAARAPGRAGRRGLRARPGHHLGSAARARRARHDRGRGRARGVRHAGRGPAARGRRRGAGRRRRVPGAGRGARRRGGALARAPALGVSARPPLLTPTFGACLGITAGSHVAVYLLNATLPLHLVALGGSHTEVGLLFSTTGVVSMLLRPAVGGWIDRYGFRPVMLPGAGFLVATLLLLPLAATPTSLIVLMGGIGLGNSVVSTGAGVLAAQASPPARRGEALGLYYVATSVSFSLGPPIGLALYAGGGLARCVLVATAIGLGTGLLVLRARGAGPAAGAAPRLQWINRRALPAAATLVSTNVGYTSIYAFLPLYAIATGGAGDLTWFYALFSACIVLGRLALARLSDRVGRAQVIGPAIAASGAAYALLSLPPRPTSLAAAAILHG